MCQGISDLATKGRALGGSEVMTPGWSPDCSSLGVGSGPLGEKETEMAVL